MAQSTRTILTNIRILMATLETIKTPTLSQMVTIGNRRWQRIAIVEALGMAAISTQGPCLSQMLT